MEEDGGFKSAIEKTAVQSELGRQKRSRGQ